MATKNNALTTPAVLAFERKLECSDAVFYQTDSRQKDAAVTPVTVREKTIRGTASHRNGKASKTDPAKLDMKIENANIQTIDTATLDPNNDTLIVRFTLKILPFDGRPNVCNQPAYQQKLQELVPQHLTNSLQELAKRYAANLANARWLWRNRLNAQHISIRISHNQDSVSIDNAKDLPLNCFNDTDGHPDVQTVAAWIQQGLSGQAPLLLNIEAALLMGNGQEVFPSQEFIHKDKKDKKPGQKEKVLYSINQTAGMHSQKIGNAIRTVDNWYPDAQFPIAAEPYGAVTTLGTAFRPRKKHDFYTLLDNWLLKDELPAPEQRHYLTAVLIRGGVFGESGKE
ncbi:MAG: type I-F CRISPR-associated protein Csy3 [Conchiformibius sp.]|nr:type I-F CRISPR-associated protein Csy3 [Conchiformibius sp.]